MSSRALRFRRRAVLVPGLAPDPDPLLCLSRIALLSDTSRRLGWLPRGDPNARSWLRLTALPDLQCNLGLLSQRGLWGHQHLIWLHDKLNWPKHPRAAFADPAPLQSQRVLDRAGAT